jgi:NadR type nicotinamide-nucleotide adenylyltransferase
MQLKKIVAIGPESTGKSTLCAQLAEHFKTQWVPEYAREYLLKHGTNYKFEDLYTIAQGQIKGEEDVLRNLQPSTLNAQPIFIDTDLTVIRVWSEFVFGQCDNRVLTGIVNRRYDLYLLCNIDLPWIKDELREYPDPGPREKLSHYYKETMINQPVPWVDISGNYEERLQKAIDAVNKLL